MAASPITITSPTQPSTAVTSRAPTRVPVFIKLGLLLLIASIVPMVVATIVNLQRGVTTVEVLALDSLSRVSQVTATELDRLVQDVRQLQSLISRDPAVVAMCEASPLDKEALRPGVMRLLQDIKETHANVASAFIVGSDGIGIASLNPRNVGQDLNFRQYVQEAIAGKQYVSEIVIGKTSREAGAYFSGPVRSAAGDTIGALVLKLDGEAVQHICRSADVGGAGFVTLINRFGIVLAHQDPAMLYRSLAKLSDAELEALNPQVSYDLDVIETMGLDREIANTLRTAKSVGSVSFLSPATQETLIVGYAPMQTTEWVVGVVKPRSDFDRPLQDLRQQQAIIVTLVGLSATLVGLIVSRRFVDPIKRLTHSAAQLAGGDYTVRAAVKSRDEVGQLAQTFNEMVPQLYERAQMADSLKVAQSIQQGLLPSTAPVIAGLDIAGRNVPADRTGGDYYDYIDLSQWSPGSVAIAIGDITGHGVPSALLMCTARALLRAHATPPGPLPQLAASINVPLYHDTPSNRFMTLMYAVVDRPNRSIKLVSAGHDAVLVYNPDDDTFFEIEGHDIPLGIDPAWEFSETVHEQLPPNAVLLFGTDGIWECQSPGEGPLYGKEPLQALLRKHRDSHAKTIVETLIEDLIAYRGGTGEQQLDDITVVVLRFTNHTPDNAAGA